MRLFFTFIMIFSVEVLFSQQKIYVDMFGNKTTKELADLYRVITKKDTIFVIEDYFLSGKLQMRAFANTPETHGFDDFVGEYQTFFENGKLHILGENSDSGRKIIFFNEEGKKSSEEISTENWYKNFIYSVDNKDFTRYLYRGITNDVSKQIIFENDTTKIRYETHYYKDDTQKSFFYDKEGKLIGELFSDAEGNTQGVEVEYFTNPMSVKKIAQISKNEVDTYTKFYKNGRKFSELKKENNQKIETFFNKQGEKLGDLIYIKKDSLSDELMPYQGVYYQLSDEGEISDFAELQFSNLVKNISYYLTGELKSETFYGMNGNIEKILFFDKKGKEISNFIYNTETLEPWEGKLYYDLDNNFSFFEYKEGKLVQEKAFYDLNNVKYVSILTKEGLFKEYFDKKGQKILDFVEKQENEYLVNQYKNSKKISSSVIKNNFIQKGDFFSEDEENKTKKHYKAKGKWIYLKTFKNNILIKEEKILKDVPENLLYDNFYIDFNIN